MLIIFSIVKLILIYTCYIIAIKIKTWFKRKALVRSFKKTLRRKKIPKGIVEELTRIYEDILSNKLSLTISLSIPSLYYRKRLSMK